MFNIHIKCLVHAGQRQLDEKLHPVPVVEPTKPQRRTHSVYCCRRPSGLRYFYEEWSSQAAGIQRPSSLNLRSASEERARVKTRRKTLFGSDISCCFPPIRRKLCKETPRESFDKDSRSGTGTRQKSV